MEPVKFITRNLGLNMGRTNCWCMVSVVCIEGQRRLQKTVDREIQFEGSGNIESFVDTIC